MVVYAVLQVMDLMDVLGCALLSAVCRAVSDARFRNEATSAVDTLTRRHPPFLQAC